MQIDAIHLDHFLSFNKFVWEGLDPHLNVIVGPNGVGKTNLFHALRAVCDVLNPERARASARWDTAGYQGVDANAITITLDIQFTTSWEKRLLCIFFASVLCNQQEIQQTIQQEIQKGATEAERQRSVTQSGLKGFDAWVLAQLRPEDITWFLRGRLVITHAGRSGWQCRYEARPKEPSFRLNLTNWSTLCGHAEHAQETSIQNWGSLFVAWYHSLTERERDQLVNGLTRAASEEKFPTPKFSRLPDWVSSQQGINLQVEDQTQIVDPTILATRQALTSAIRISSLDSGRLIGMRIIFQQLLNQSLVFTDNVRLPYQREFNARDLYKQSFDLSNGKELARFLFCKKNGGPQDREQYTAIGLMFSRMTERRFEVVQRPAETSGTQQEPQPDISLELVTTSSWGDIPLEFSGAGIAEALFLSAVLAGSTGQIVLLDEPALNLSPTMQTALLSELLSLAHQSEKSEKSQFLVNTHTANLVPPDAIDRVSRFTLQDGQTIRRALDVREISQDERSDFRRLLRGNLAARTLLFSRTVILLEGETELAALPVWCPELERQNVALYVVHGADHVVGPLKFVQRFAIPWAIIGDGEMLWKRQNRKRPSGPQVNVNAIVATANRSLPPIPGDPGENVQNFAQWRQSLEAYGIFTLANGSDEGFEKALQQEIPPDLWKLAHTQFGSNKVARGRFIAENCACPKTVAELIQKVLHYLYQQEVDICIPSGN